MKRKSLTLAQKKGFVGVLFALPLIIGMTLFFVLPLIQSLRFSFSQLNMESVGFSLKFIGLENFRTAIAVNPEFNRHLGTAITGLLVDVPAIIILSLLFAVILNQKFKGRTLARAIFFLPVILASGAIARVDSTDFLQTVLRSTLTNSANQAGLQSFQLEQMLLNSGVNVRIVEYLTSSVNRIYQIVGSLGVQMLIFLAGLQAIPASLYEASKVEGATGYETFWMITFPMVTPLILTNVIYSVVDSFANNELATFLREMAFIKLNFGLSAAMSWIYFLCISLILFLLTKIISKYVFYQDAEK